MTIEERMIRREPEDLMAIGQVLESFYNSDAGAVLRAIVNGRVAKEAKIHRDGSRVKPGRALGRIEAYQQIIDDVEVAIAEYHDLIRPLPEENQDET